MAVLGVRLVTAPQRLLHGLQIRATPGAAVESTDQKKGWRMSLPPGAAGRYRWAQLDDYLHLRRRDFAWQPPFRLALRTRVSAANLPGTWGFGFWNDPFNLSLGLGGTARRLPALPNCAWFFHASPPNYLSLRDDLPADGFLAATFASPCIPSLLLAPALAAAPLLAWRVSSRWIRRQARRLVRQDAALVKCDPTGWHHYTLTCLPERVCFEVDDELCFETTFTPRGRLGLVIWIDNQYAAYPPDGGLRFGTLDAPQAAWLEVSDLEITPTA